MANGVVFLPSYHEAIKDLPDSDRLQMYDAIVRYGLYGEITELSAVTKALFTLIKPNIDSSQNRYRAAKENGQKGGRPKNQRENQKRNQTENQDIDNDTDNDTDKDSDNDTDKDSDFDSESDAERECREKTESTERNRFYEQAVARGLPDMHTVL